MTRIAENQSARNLLTTILRNRESVNRLGDQISSGIKVKDPGDSPLAGSISQYRAVLERVDGYKTRIASVQSFLTFQDNSLREANDIMIRAGEIATQSANETNDPVARQQMAAEVWQLRDHLVTLANGTYGGRYVWGGADDDDPPFDAATYVNPATGAASQRYIHDAELGTAQTRDVKVSDDLTITVNTAGNTVWSDSIAALERLGRALEGYETLPAAGLPDGTGVAFVFPADYTRQTQALQGAIDVIDDARQNDIMIERVSIGGKMRRLDTASSLIGLAQVSGQEVLDKLQNTDITEAASNLTIAQQALEASMIVSNRVLNLSILDYL